MKNKFRLRFSSSRSQLGKWLLFGTAIGFLAYGGLAQQNNTQSAAATSPNELLATDKHHQSVVVATSKLANKFHYRNKPLTNELSEEILGEYLEALDPQRVYFLAADIRNFESNRFYYDNFLQKGDLAEVFHIFEIYQHRVRERTDHAISLLDYPFDFELNEQMQIDRSLENWPADGSEQDTVWKKLVKHDILTLNLSNESEERTTEILKSRYQRFQNTISMSNAFDVIEIFLNAYLKELDPHSEFFSPHSSSNLRISISQQLEGIGAMLRTENEHTVVQGIITGGPAHLSKRLHVGDRIVAVGNPDGSIYEDIVGWRLEDVVDLIRGPKGTTVHLKILRKDAAAGSPADSIAIVRQRVKLEEQMAKKSTFELETEGRIMQLGVIQLPSFYSNFLDSDGSDNTPSSSAGDVRRYLDELKSQGVDGVIVDLRGNGGGALREAVDLTSMFIPAGPIVQVEDSEDHLEVHEDFDGNVVYDGPLVVLVDRGSASASEIFAGAIQDYGRGVIVGETTFGKGTLQNIWPLSQLAQKDDIDLGALKLSTAQFFRVNGTSTQHLGVVPDVLFPTNKFVSKSGERALDNALPSSVIEPSKGAQMWRQKLKIEKNLPEIKQLNRARVELNPLMKILVERDQQSFHRTAPSVVSLNINERQSTLATDRSEQLAYINKVRSLLGLDAAETISDEAFPSEMIGDIFLDEAVNILADLVTLQSSGAKIASQSNS